VESATWLMIESQLDSPTFLNANPNTSNLILLYDDWKFIQSNPIQHVNVHLFYFILAWWLSRSFHKGLVPLVWDQVFYRISKMIIKQIYLRNGCNVRSEEKHGFCFGHLIVSRAMEMRKPGSQ